MESISLFIESCEQLNKNFSNFVDDYKAHPEKRTNIHLRGRNNGSFDSWLDAKRNFKEEVKALSYHEEDQKLLEIREELDRIKSVINSNTKKLTQELDQHNALKCIRFCDETIEYIDWFNIAVEIESVE